ncbi:hypothetical protein [Butyrivibrio sp. MC2021]|uniref:hypothetical protein n=1 Tax=Butyrivibrio sp. MC2021 TaxID=1408306 RepID=UPI00047A7EC5|nr:hypothetical protein [Butyrivibrio sp. MC2021]
MRVRKYYGLLAVIGCILVLSGCGEQFPELTQEEYDQTVEYAVGLLMKYSNNGQERLVYVDAKEEQKSRERQARKDAKEAAKEQESTTQTTPQQPAPQPVAEPTADNPSGDTQEQTMTGEDLASRGDSGSENIPDTGSAEAEANPQAITISADDSQEIAQDLFLSYEGYSVSSTFPESSKSYVVNADKGKKLLVLRFDLYNGSDSSKDVNMIKYNLLFQVLLNDKNIGYTSVTFLPNDLSSFIGTIESRAHESLVVLTQIDASEATHIETLGLIVGEGGNEQVVYLK